MNRKRQNLTREILLGIAALSSFAAHPDVIGCDMCGCYTPQHAAALPNGPTDAAVINATGAATSWTSGLYFAAAEQFTHYGTLQFEGNEVPNPVNQHLDSSITQLVAGYGFSDRVSVQINLPVIYRSFTRPKGFALEHGTESGIGDISVLASFTPIRFEKGGGRAVTFDDPKSPRMEPTDPGFAFSLSVFSALKMPTGQTSRLKEEFHENEVPGAPESGIHGHDLTLGTGSWDGIFGGQALVRYRNAFLQSDLQFTLRGDGEHQYDFANDLTWSGGPGYYFIRNAHLLFAVQAVVSGEHKDVDQFRGKPAEDTGLTAISFGPRVIVAMGRFSADIGGDFPVSIDNTALQVVADYRIRGGISVQF